MKLIYIGVRIPLINGKTVEEIISIFKDYAEEAIVEDRQEYRWFFTHCNEVCIIHSTSNVWIKKQAEEWIKKCGQIEARPVWIEQLDDVLGHEYFIEILSPNDFNKAYRLGTAEPGKKRWNKFTPGKPAIRAKGYKPSL